METGHLAMTVTSRMCVPEKFNMIWQRWAWSSCRTVCKSKLYWCNIIQKDKKSVWTAGD